MSHQAAERRPDICRVEPCSTPARSADSSRARAAGLRCRPFAETARDTWDWLRTRGPAEDTDAEGRKGAPGSLFRQGIEPAKEQRLLAAHG